MRSPALSALLLAALIVGTGATASESPAQETTGGAGVPAELFGTEWRMVEMDGRAPESDLPPVTLSFGPARAEGSGGCNWYAAWLEEGADETLLVSTLTSTRRDCIHPRIMEQEARYLAALGEVSGYRLMAGELALVYGSGEVPARLVFTSD